MQIYKKFRDKLTSLPFLLKAIPTSVAILYLLSFLVFLVIASLEKGVNFAGYAADGPFQLYNPLRRLAAGEVIGRDFQFFHGIGVPLIHYPLFWLLGSNVFASETTRWLVSGLLFLSSAAVFFYLALKNVWKTIVATAVCLYLATIFAEVIYPGNSLLGVRTTAPLVFAAMMFWKSDKVISIKSFRIPLPQFLLAIIATLAILLGSEQGIAVLIAYTIAQLFRKRQEIRTTLTNLGYFYACFIPILLTTMTIITLGHPFKPLTYSLVDVSKDQAWYFGTPPNPFLAWNNVGWLFHNPYLISVCWFLFALTLLWLTAHKLKLIAGKNHILMFMLLYGLIAFVVPAVGGYVAASQAIPLMRMLIPLTIYLTMILIFSDIVRDKILAVHGKAVLIAMLVISFAISAGGIYLAQTLYHSTKSMNVRGIISAAFDARNGDDRLASDPDWKYRLDTFIPITKSETIWSTYASLYESYTNQLHPSKDGHDYIIHTLGPERRQAYERQFITENPPYVITMKPSYFHYEEWLWSRHWNFYKHLIQNYKLIAQVNSHYLWQYNKNAYRAAQDQWQEIKPDKNNVYRIKGTSPDATELYEVQVRYHADALLPFTKSLPRYLIRPYNTGLKYEIALPPYEKQWTFVLPVIYPPETPAFEFAVEGLFPGKLRDVEVYIRKQPVSKENMLPFINNYCIRQDLSWLDDVPVCRDAR